MRWLGSKISLSIWLPQDWLMMLSMLGRSCPNTSTNSTRPSMRLASFWQPGAYCHLCCTSAPRSPTWDHLCWMLKLKKELLSVLRYLFQARSCQSSLPFGERTFSTPKSEPCGGFYFCLDKFGPTVRIRRFTETCLTKSSEARLTFCSFWEKRDLLWEHIIMQIDLRLLSFPSITG